MPRRAAAGLSGQRQLFDPGRHDPVRFSTSNPSQPGSSSGGPRRRGLLAYTPSASSQSSVTDSSSVLDSSSAISSSAYGTDASEPPPGRGNALAETFRRAYQHILGLEASCAREAELERKGAEDRPDEFVRDETPTVFVWSGESAHDDRYWVNAIARHKE
jgi:hypothetical protein